MSADLITQFINYLQNNNRSESTVVAYQKDISQLDKFTPEKPLRKLTTDDIKQVLNTLHNEKGFTPKTISRKLNSYRTFYKYLQQEGQISSNPAISVNHPKVKQKSPRVLSNIEFLALREISRPNPRLYTMIELMLQTGMRIGEISRLKIKDLNLDNEKPTLTVTDYSTNPQRNIQLNSKAIEILTNYLAQLGSQPEEAPVFATRDGNHIIIRNIRSSIDRAMAKAGIEDACVNDLRNTFIVGQLKSGIPVELIADAVGHRSRTTTTKYLDLLEQPYKQGSDVRLVNL